MCQKSIFVVTIIFILGKFESDPQIQRIQRIQGFHANQHQDEGDEEATHEYMKVVSEDEEVEENEDFKKSDEDAEEDDNDDDNDICPMTVQNKFSFLPDED